MKIGSVSLSSPYILAPMAGITDLPFRVICREMGAGLAVTEMINANSDLWETDKSRFRLDFVEEIFPTSVQILGVDPDMMANAARLNEINGAHIIDINMGCPAKKICKQAAGSALMRNERLVVEILEAVVSAVEVPVTLKMRTGWDNENKNAITIAKIAESIGIKAITVHGRTRMQGFSGEAEYDTIAAIKSQLSIPVIANGDIFSVEKANKVLAYTNADALMIGRGAYGNPWIFRSLIEQNEYYPSKEEKMDMIRKHLGALKQFYGEFKGVQMARKHILWYLNSNIINKDWRHKLLAAKTQKEQFLWINKIVNDHKDAA